LYFRPHCIICAQFTGPRRAPRWRECPDAPSKTRRVYAACLRARARLLRNAPQQQETPGTGIPEVSTAHPMVEMEVRAAGAQSDTDG